MSMVRGWCFGDGNGRHGNALIGSLCKKGIAARSNGSSNASPAIDLALQGGNCYRSDDHVRDRYTLRLFVEVSCVSFRLSPILKMESDG